MYKYLQELNSNINKKFVTIKIKINIILTNILKLAKYSYIFFINNNRTRQMPMLQSEIHFSSKIHP
jgi:hypothetical protein